MSTTEQIVSLLIAERDRLDRAIQALQEPMAHRGRPPKNPFLIGGTAMNGGGQARSAAQRKAQSEKMKVYWAKRRAEAAKA